MSPLALMIRPHGSSPHHSLALVLALATIRASKPFPLVHITSSAPSMLIALGGENSLSNSLVRSGRDRPVAAVTDVGGALSGAHRTWFDPASRGDKAPVASPRHAL